MEKLWPMKKKKGGGDILTNMLLSLDMARRQKKLWSENFSLWQR